MKSVAGIQTEAVEADIERKLVSEDVIAADLATLHNPQL
jgi:hypothetical protein